MSKVSAEMPTKAQQNDIGTLSTNPVGGGFATGGVAVRITPAGVEGAAPLNLTVAFIGVSGVGAMRAVSFRGAADALRFSTGRGPGLPGEGGETGRVGKGAGGRRPAGGGGNGEGPAAEGGEGGLNPDGAGGSGAFASDVAGGGGVFSPIGGGSG